MVANLFTRGCGICQRDFDLEPVETLALAIAGATLGTVADATGTRCTATGAAATAGIAATTLVADGVPLASDVASLRKDPRMWVS